MTAAEGQVRFAILCLGRSGSTHLQSLIDSHPDACCFGELFNPRAPEPPAFAHSEQRDEREYLDELLGGRAERAVGFKLPMNSIRAHPRAAALVGDDPRMRVIRLSRRNLLAQFVSRRMMATTKVSQSIFGSYGDATVVIEPARCLEALEAMEADARELDRLASARPVLAVIYEQLVAGEGIDELQRFLGLEPAALRSWFTRLRTRSLAETVENWDEVAAALRRTRFEGFLSENA